MRIVIGCQLSLKLHNFHRTFLLVTGLLILNVTHLYNDSLYEDNERRLRIYSYLITAYHY